MAKKLSYWMFRYGVAVLAVGTALAFILIPHIGKGLVSLLYLAVLISAWYGGLGPGLLATTLITGLFLLSLTTEPDLAAWRIVSIVLFVAGGVVITLVVEVLHVTRRRVEASQQWLAAVLNSIGDAVITTDAQGRTSFLNPVAQTLTGWKSEEAAGKPLTEIFRIVSEDTHLPVESPVSQVLREGTIMGLANHTVLIARDGTERPIDDSGAPIKVAGGAATGVVLVFRDVTHRRQAEEVLDRLAAIIEASEDAIIGQNLDGIVTSWNAGAERLYGYKAEEMLGNPIDPIIPSDRQNERRRSWNGSRRGEAVDHFESMRMTKDGRLIDVSPHHLTDPGRTWRIVGASRIARDITDRKRMEQELRRRLEELDEANRRKDEFWPCWRTSCVTSGLDHQRDPVDPAKNRRSIRIGTAHGGSQPPAQAPVAADRRPLRRIANYPREDPTQQGTARRRQGRRSRHRVDPGTHRIAPA